MRRIKKRAWVLAFVCAAGLACHLASGAASLKETVPAGEGHHGGAQASRINERGFTLTVDGRTFLSVGESDDPETFADMYLSSDMHLMMDMSAAAKIFGARVFPDGAGGARVNDIRLDDVTALDDQTGRYALDVTASASALGYDAAWREDTEEMLFEKQRTENILPETFDLREETALTPVRSQGDMGTCWAFAALAALESSAGRGADWILSVDHMTMNNGFNIASGDGGDYNMALAYLAGWNGPVPEADDPYGDGVTDPKAGPVAHVQEAVMPAEKDLASIKRHVMEDGGVESSLYLSISSPYESNGDYDPENGSYYYAGDEKPNHDVVIVGWDDTFSADRFASRPGLDGAFICRNSWGTDFADGGYFYVSYEDANIGKTNICYTRIDDTDNYDHIFQTDRLGWVGSVGYDQSEAWFANVYTAGSEQTLRAVGFYATGADTCFDLYVVPEYTDETGLDGRIYLGSGWLAESGYYTVDIEKDIVLKEGTDYAVIVDIDTRDAAYPVAIEYRASELTDTADIRDGRGYISADAGAWASSEQEYQCNVCLKAFTDERNEQ